MPDETFDTFDESMRTFIEPDGGLYSIADYVCWHPGRDEIKLDGDFTADQLRWFADYMDRVNG